MRYIENSNTIGRSKIIFRKVIIPGMAFEKIFNIVGVVGLPQMYLSEKHTGQLVTHVKSVRVAKRASYKTFPGKD